MLYYNNRNTDCIFEASDKYDFDDLIVHNRCRKTDTVDFNHLDDLIVHNRCLDINDILGHTNRKGYLIKNYYKNLF